MLSPENPVSIIIPSYNRASTLRQVLRTYQQQSGVGEIILVDDASTDDTGALFRAAAQDDPRLIYLRNERRSGSPASRNRGIRRATGDYILFGEDDLRLAPDYVETLRACLERTDSSIIGGRALYPLPGESDEEVLRRTDRPVVDRVHRRRIFFDASAAAADDLPAPFLHTWTLVRREVFAEVRYDEGYGGNAYREETDFCLSALARGHRITFCPHTFCVHLPRQESTRGGQWADGIWKYKLWSLRNNRRFLRKHWDFLRSRHLVSGSRAALMLSFTASELQRLATYYLRRIAPGLHAKLARRMAGAREGGTAATRTS